MYIFGTVNCVLCATIFGFMGNIPAVVGFIIAALGGWFAYLEKKDRLKLEQSNNTERSMYS